MSGTTRDRNTGSLDLVLCCKVELVVLTVSTDTVNFTFPIGVVVVPVEPLLGLAKDWSFETLLSFLSVLFLFSNYACLIFVIINHLSTRKRFSCDRVMV